ncbi:tyrosine-type recombinase/integrase [Bacillus sp. UMB0728]|uniref:tyrosine-type recombinase/integrase n=1 Tax=Bacillus sp. UMB0728 TaxID=2066052 RepID=UPI000C78AA5D|nr:site-specific integrase [Bacillus sp. UMB0728]PLR72319.1 recombinase [Bacillus sp. UMB0728]
MTIEKNMLRDRAKRMPDVTDEMWKLVNQEYRELVEEYISVQSHSPATKKQYISGLRQFGYYVYSSMNNKPFHKITKRDFMRYMSFLRDDRKMSPSGIGFKKACVSSLCNYIENVIVGEEDFKHYDLFRNFTRGLPAIPKSSVYEKVKISYDEYKEMMQVLESDENYLGMAWLATAFNVGARRSEIIQFKTEITKYDFPEESTFIYSHNVRLKGRGIDGKVEPYMVNREALQYINLWLEKRGYDHEYIFTTKYDGKIEQMSSGWANYFCSNVLSDILGRRINPHLFKASCVTFLLEQGIKLELVSKYVAHHEQVGTTIAHYDLRDFEEEKNQIFK